MNLKVDHIVGSAVRLAIRSNHIDVVSVKSLAKVHDFEYSRATYGKDVFVQKGFNLSGAQKYLVDVIGGDCTRAIRGILLEAWSQVDLVFCQIVLEENDVILIVITIS